MFQTRYGTNCFAILAGDSGARNAFITVTIDSSVVFPPKKHHGVYMPGAVTHIRAYLPAGYPERENLSSACKFGRELSSHWTSRTGKCESRNDEC